MKLYAQSGSQAVKRLKTRKTAREACENIFQPLTGKTLGSDCALNFHVRGWVLLKFAPRKALTFSIQLFCFSRLLQSRYTNPERDKIGKPTHLWALTSI